MAKLSSSSKNLSSHLSLYSWVSQTEVRLFNQRLGESVSSYESSWSSCVSVQFLAVHQGFYRFSKIFPYRFRDGKLISPTWGAKTLEHNETSGNSTGNDGPSCSESQCLNTFSSHPPRSPSTLSPKGFKLNSWRGFAASSTVGDYPLLIEKLWEMAGSFADIWLFLTSLFPHNIKTWNPQWIGLLGKILTGNPWVFTCFYHQI